MKLHGKLIIAFLSLMGLLLSGCTSDSAPISIEEFETRKVPAAPNDFITTSNASLSAIGDILVHSTIYNDAKTENGYNFDPMFEKVKPFLEKSDITIANSESIIGGSEIGVSTYPSFNSPFEVGDTLKNVGVDVVAMANNHTLDRGIKAIENAIDYWDEIGIEHTGSYLSDKESAEITTITKNDITFSFLSYTYGTNGIPTPDGKEYLVNRIDEEKIKADLSKAKEQSDVVVLNLHFGDEYQRMPNELQKELAHFSAENGADIILGHHPHVLQPAEWIETADGRRSFVIYSLGNFISGQTDLHKRIGGILHLNVEKTAGTNVKKITIKEPSFTNTYVRNTNFRNFELDLLKNVDPAINEDIKVHMATWMEDLKFEE